MCQTTTAVEDDQDGNDNLDSVLLSLTELENNCSCTIAVKNASYINTFSLNIKPTNLTEQSLCGMEIDIYFIKPDVYFLLNRRLTTCTSEETTIRLSLFRNEYIQLTSRVVDGNFSIGYCIQIIREPRQGEEDSFLEISCDGPAVTTPIIDTFTQPRTTLNDVTTSVQITLILASSTAMTDTSPIHDKSDSDVRMPKQRTKRKAAPGNLTEATIGDVFANISCEGLTSSDHKNNLQKDKTHKKKKTEIGDSTLYIALGTVGGFIICVLLSVGILLCIRQLSITEADPADNRNMQYDSLSGSRNTLNYSTLNRTSEDIDEQQYEIVNSNAI